MKTHRPSHIECTVTWTHVTYSSKHSQMDTRHIQRQTRSHGHTSHTAANTVTWTHVTYSSKHGHMDTRHIQQQTRSNGHTSHTAANMVKCPSWSQHQQSRQTQIKTATNRASSLITVHPVTHTHMHTHTYHFKSHFPGTGTASGCSARKNVFGIIYRGKW